MVAYSGTFTPTMPNGDASFTLRDPIAEAREMLRLAARVPWRAVVPVALSGSWE